MPYQGLLDDLTSLSVLLARTEGADIICIFSGACGMLLSFSSSADARLMGRKYIYLSSVFIPLLLSDRVLLFDKICTTCGDSSNFSIIRVISVYQQLNSYWYYISYRARNSFYNLYSLLPVFFHFLQYLAGGERTKMSIQFYFPVQDPFHSCKQSAGHTASTR